MSKLMSKLEQTAKIKSPRKPRSTQQGGLMYVKGNLYARIQYFDEKGNRKSKTKPIPSGKKTDAWKAVREMRKELEQYGEETLNADKMTFLELAEKYKKDKVFEAIIKDGRKVSGLKSVKPVETYVKIASEYFGKKLLRSIKPRDIEGYKNTRLKTPVVFEINEREKKLNPETKRMKFFITKVKRVTERKLSSVNRELATFRRMLNFAVNEGWLISNPFAKTDKIISNASEKPRERVLEYAEENRLLAECKDEREHIKPILICALHTAMRPFEMFKIVWSDIDFDNGIIVLRAEITKPEMARTVGLTPRLKEELEKLWELGPKQLDKSVFGVKSIRTAFETARDKAGIKHFTFRDCRHTATTRMVNSGMPQAEIMKVTGHTQLRTFLRYVNLTAASISQNATSFGDFLEKKFAEIKPSEIIVQQSDIVN
jgi:integrase